MKGLIRGLVLGAVLGGTLGVAVGIVAFPTLVGTPAAVGDPDERPRGALVGHGAFAQADPQDPEHWGAGTFRLYEGLLRLNGDFEVAPGPKYHLYLCPDADIGPHTPVYDSMFIDLGPLRAFAGSQAYPVPAGVDAARYPSVVVWSEQLQELISPAGVRPVD
ncbi:MAG: DM13 domain-containing protein [Chromatiales bacterium]|jgi:hypothetical protein